MDLSRRSLLTAPVALGLATPALAGESDFALAIDQGRIKSLRYRHDRFETDYIAPGQVLGDLRLAWRQVGGNWQTADTRTLPPAPRHDLDGLRVETGFTAGPRGLDWTIAVTNTGPAAIELGDLGLPLPMHTQFKSGQPATAAVLKHSFVSGHGSFVFWMRSNSAGPFLMMTPHAGTSLEFWDHRHGDSEAWCA